MTELLATGIVATMTILSGSMSTGVVSLQQLPVSCIQATDECGNTCNRASWQDSWACTKMACITKKDSACIVTTNDEAVSKAPTMCTADYNPVCATKQVQCIKAPCDPIKQTYSNACMAAADQAIVISQGECEADVIVWNDKDEHGCIGSAGYIWSEDTQQCIRPREEKQNIITWAHSLWITKFETVADFNWDALVTREQAAKMIMTAIDTSGLPEWMIKQPEWSCVWTDADMIDSSLLPMVTRSCMKGLFHWSNGKFMPRAYLTDIDTMTVMTRASQYIPALADIMMRSKFAVTGKPLTRGELLSRIQWLITSIQGSIEPTQPEVDLDQAQKDLNIARTLWDAKKLTTYSLVQTRSCFCPTEYTRAMMYHVINGMINTWSLVYADDGKQVTIETQLNTVNQAFDMIQEAIDAKVANVTVSYDSIYGYPTSITIDRDFMIADEEMYYNYKLITDSDVVLSWDYVLDTYNGTKVGNNAISLTFTADHISAKMCNNIGSTYNANKESISFWPMMSTEMYCNDTTLMDLESKFGSLSTASYTTTATTLTMSASGSTWMWIKK